MQQGCAVWAWASCPQAWRKFQGARFLPCREWPRLMGAYFCSCSRLGRSDRLHPRVTHVTDARPQTRRSQPAHPTEPRVVSRSSAPQMANDRHCGGQMGIAAAPVDIPLMEDGSAHPHSGRGGRRFKSCPHDSHRSVPTGLPAIAHGLLTDAMVTGLIVRLHGDHIPILTWAFVEPIETTRPR